MQHYVPFFAIVQPCLAATCLAHLPLGMPAHVHIKRSWPLVLTEFRCLCSCYLQCRVEGNPQNMSQFRVTVVSGQPSLSASLKTLIVSRLTSL